MNLAPAEYWDNSYKQMALDIVPPQDTLRLWLQKNIPPGGNATCLEIGCFPGRYLAVLGKMNYKLYGVDLTERVIADLPLWLKEQGCQVGEFFREDAIAFASHSDKTFDLVCSFGFIEHFINWPEILELHARQVSIGGLLVVAVPNFAGLLQRGLHRILDTENFKRHNVAAMCPEKWRDQLAAAGFSVSFSGPIGSFDFWTDNPNANRLQIIGSALVTRMIPLVRCLPPSLVYSPFYGIIARKNS
jgi:SAM-dependent methyltransferase